MSDKQTLLIASVLTVLPVMAIAAVAVIVGIIHRVRGRRSGHTLLTNDDIRPAARILSIVTRQRIR